MKHRISDDDLKKMVVDLSKLKGSVKQAAMELEIDASRMVICQSSTLIVKTARSK